MRFIEWELDEYPEFYNKLRCREVIDQQTLTHVIANVDCPDGVTNEAFVKVLNEVAEVLDKVPYIKIGAREGMKA